MVPVIICWIVYLFFFARFIFFGLRINNSFLLTLAVLAVLMIALVLWTVHRVTEPSKRKKQAAAAQAAARLAVDRAVASAADSGTITFRVAGVTFKNEDGKSRQDILRHMKFGDKPYADDPEDLTGTIEETTFEGEQAFEVYVNGYLVGHVPKSLVRKVAKAKEHVATCYVSDVTVIGGGTDEDGNRISYGCEITLEY